MKENLSKNEFEYVRTSLEKGLRLDGRGIVDWRPIELQFGDQLGYAECALGSTLVSCQVSASIGEPAAERPFEGTVTVQADFTPLAGLEHDLYRQSESEATVGRLLEKTIKSSGVIDRETLCLNAGERAWALRIDIHFLNDDGNALDCASIATLAALLHYRRPSVTISDGLVTVHPLEERVGVPLAINHSPVTTTFALFGRSIKDGVSDPTQLEETCAEGMLSVALNVQGELTLVSKTAGSPLSVDDILRLINRAERRTIEVDELIRRKVAEDLDAKQIEIR